MKNADMPASPVIIADNVVTEPRYGLTKREVMSMHAMAGLLSQSYSSSNDMLASKSVSLADALLKELERTAK